MLASKAVIRLAVKIACAGSKGQVAAKKTMCAHQKLQISQARASVARTASPIPLRGKSVVIMVIVPSHLLAPATSVIHQLRNARLATINTMAKAAMRVQWTALETCAVDMGCATVRVHCLVLGHALVIVGGRMMLTAAVVTSVRLAMDQLESAILLCVHKVVESMATAPVQTYALVTQVGRVWRVTRRRVRILHPRDFPTALVMESARRPTFARAKMDIKEEDARSARQLVVQQRAAATIQSSATHAASIHRRTRASAQIQGINARDVTVVSVMVKVRRVAAQIVTAKKNQLS